MVTVHWDGVPLGDALAKLADASGTAVFVDRRVDPSGRVSLSAKNATAEQILRQLTTDRELGLSSLNTVWYVGPPETTGPLRTLAALREEEAGSLPRRAASILRREEPLSWPRLTEPRTLIVEMLERYGWAVEHAERIAYDLWPAGSLPKLSGIDRLTVLLAGFDLTFRIRADENAIEIVPIERPVRLLRRYRPPRLNARQLDSLRQQLPSASLGTDDGALVLTGRVEEHERLAELISGLAAGGKPTRPGRPASSRRRYTLRVEEQPVGVVIDELAKRLDWKIGVDNASLAAAGLTLEDRVTFSVSDADQDELLRALLEPAGLDYRREADRVIVIARRPAEGSP